MIGIFRQKYIIERVMFILKSITDYVNIFFTIFFTCIHIQYVYVFETRKPEMDGFERTNNFGS